MELGVLYLVLRKEWLVYYKDKKSKDEVGNSSNARRNMKKKWIQTQRANEQWRQCSLGAVKKNSYMTAATFRSRVKDSSWSKLSKFSARLIPVHGKGFGIEALMDIRASVFIAEYVGKIISTTQAKDLCAHEQTHLKTIAGTGLVIDGIRDPVHLPFIDSRFASFASFANHSESPNCFLCVIETLNRVFLITARDVTKSEELTISYGKLCFSVVHMSVQDASEQG